MNTNQNSATQGQAIVGTATWAEECGIPVLHDHIAYELMLGRGRAEVPDDNSEARTIAQVTGSVAATVTHDHRDPVTGEIVIDSVSTFDRVSAQAGCAWFALCDRRAVGTVAHPILGAIPTCQRCVDTLGLTLNE